MRKYTRPNLGGGAALHWMPVQTHLLTHRRAAGDVGWGIFTRNKFHQCQCCGICIDEQAAPTSLLDNHVRVCVFA